MGASASEGVKVVVTGGRKYTDIGAIFRALDRFHQEHAIARLAHGNANGADKIAGVWASDRGIAFKRYPVPKEEWDLYGPGAGPRRNERMLQEEQPDWVIAFPGGTGTADCCTRATKMLIPIYRPIKS